MVIARVLMSALELRPETVSGTIGIETMEPCLFIQEINACGVVAALQQRLDVGPGRISNRSDDPVYGIGDEVA
jgi:hypothetical protein